MIDDNSNIAEITPEENVLIPEIELPVEIPEETIIEPIIETVEIKPKAKGRPKESKDKTPKPQNPVGLIVNTLLLIDLYLKFEIIKCVEVI